ncbi:MAG: hypothetical protein K2J80_09655 [Oscillospiraceae bacterium]|nr:hypothetical protein [Oscillospiraceae bacterium]
MGFTSEEVVDDETFSEELSVASLLGKETTGTEFSDEKLLSNELFFDELLSSELLSDWIGLL